MVGTVVPTSTCLLGEGSSDVYGSSSRVPLVVRETPGSVLDRTLPEFGSLPYSVRRNTPY